MFKAPTPEIEAEVLAEYDADYVSFCSQVLRDLERNNPGLAELVYLLIETRKGGDILFGVQMACAVYRQLEKASEGGMPIVEMREALRATAFEALADPQAFLNRYGTPYFYDGLIGKRTLANFVGDAVGHGVAWELALFVPVFLIRILEAQVELDLKKRAN